MSQIFFTADTHFNHPFVAKTRNYQTAEEHDELLIERFNKIVTKRDHLWILGDLGMGSLSVILPMAARLNGVKHLVFGNHDAGHPMQRRSAAKQRRYCEVFDSVHLHEQVRIGGHRVNLSHFPRQGDHKEIDRYPEWRLRDERLPLLHGHVHAAWAESGNQLNVGVDQFPTPRSAASLEAWAATHSRGKK